MIEVLADLIAMRETIMKLFWCLLNQDQRDYRWGLQTQAQTYFSDEVVNINSLVNNDTRVREFHEDLYILTTKNEDNVFLES